MDRHPRIEGELPFEAHGEGFEGHAPVRDRLNPSPAGVAPAIVPLVGKPARFAGLTYSQLALMAAALAAAIWGMWATAKIFALEDRRVVSVRLAAIVNDFVTAEARSGTPPDQLTARTRAFMGALDSVLKNRRHRRSRSRRPLPQPSVSMRSASPKMWGPGRDSRAERLSSTCRWVPAPSLASRSARRAADSARRI